MDLGQAIPDILFMSFVMTLSDEGGVLYRKDAVRVELRRIRW